MTPWPWVTNGSGEGKEEMDSGGYEGRILRGDSGA